jgi:hypothetical protein
MAAPLDRRKLLAKLERIKDEQEHREEDPLQKMSLADALLGLARVNHETEHSLCSDVAKHLLGQVPEPDDTGFDEELEAEPPDNRRPTL